MHADAVGDLYRRLACFQTGANLGVNLRVASADIDITCPAAAHLRQYTADDGAIQAGGNKRKLGVVDRVNRRIGHNQLDLRRREARGAG